MQPKLHKHTHMYAYVHMECGSDHLLLEGDLHSVAQNDYKLNAVALIETASSTSL